MTTTRLFTTVFDEEMYSRGFKRKGRVYYKLCGELIYSVALKPINPYSIHFNVIPYWLIEYLQERFSPTYPYTKGVWAECGCDITGRLYSKAEGEQANIDYMNTCLSVAKRYMLPFMSEIKSGYDLLVPFQNLKDKNIDLNSDWPATLYEASDSIRKIQDEKLKFSRGDSGFIIFDVAPGSMDPKYEYLNKYGMMVAFVWECHVQQLLLLDMAQKEQSYENACKIWESYAPSYIYGRDIFKSKMRENNFEWIKQFRAEQEKIALPKLRDELGLSIF